MSSICSSEVVAAGQLLLSISSQPGLQLEVKCCGALLENLFTINFY